MVTGTSSRRLSGSVLPPARVALAVREAVIADGARATSTRLGLSTATMNRIAGRLPAHRASIALAAQRLGIDLEIESRHAV
jgi:hypothetical protein